MIQQGLIEIRIDNISIEETKRLQGLIHTLIENGSLHLRSGRCIMHYDYAGNLMKIDHEFIKWIKSKDSK